MIGRTNAMSNLGDWYGVCSSTPTAVAKVVTVQDGFKLKDGATVTVVFSYKNTAIKPTLNVNETGAYPITYQTGGNIDSKSWVRNEMVQLTFAYDEWVLMKPVASENTYGEVALLDTPSDALDVASGYAATPLSVINAVNDSKIWWGEAATDGINITATVGEGFVLKDGVMVRLVMDAVNPQSPNLNVNGTGNYAVISPTINSSGLAFDGMWTNGEIVEFVYYADSEAWVLINRKRATGVRFGWVTTADAKNLLQQTDNPTYQVATANAVAEALDALVATQNFEGSVFTLTAANWSTDNTYNLEVLYPSAKYNLQISISSTATAEQYEAYNAAGIVGDNSTNVLTARNGKPTIDIPVKIQMFIKNWSDM